MRDLRAARRIIVLATHDLDVVDGLLDRAVLLRRGRLRELGSEGSLRERYRATLAEGGDAGRAVRLEASVAGASRPSRSKEPQP